MEAETKQLKISEVKMDDKLYPRMHTDFVTVARYINALKSGVEFPPITVARYRNKYYLIDGRHRIESNKAIHKKVIQVEILKGLDRKQIFLEAVKRNITHGRQFSTQEVVKICITLKDWKMSQKQISEIVRIPATQIKPFVAERMTRVIGTKEKIPLKSSLRHFTETDVPASFKKSQEHISPARNQEALLDTLITLIQKDWINRENKRIARKLNKLYKLLSVYV